MNQPGGAPSSQAGELDAAHNSCIFALPNVYMSGEQVPPYSARPAAHDATMPELSSASWTSLSAHMEPNPEAVAARAAQSHAFILPTSMEGCDAWCSAICCKTTRGGVTSGHPHSRSEMPLVAQEVST